MNLKRDLKDCLDLKNGLFVFCHYIHQDNYFFGTTQSCRIYFTLIQIIKLAENKTEHYFQAFEALDELAAKISSAEFAGASFGDVEAEIHKNGMEVLHKMAQGYLNQKGSPLHIT